jgi:hypothetical protein
VDAADLVAPEDIDGSFVARGIDDAEQVAVGDELVLLGADAQATVLNPTGALIWACLDGDSTLAELVTDLSEELGVDRGLVETDVLSFARQLGQAGLLEGVGSPPPDWDAQFPEKEPVPTARVGDELDDFTLSDLDGVEHRLSEYRGRDVLLVNWSPTCGFCTMIAEPLASRQARLAERDVELLFVTRGEADANREVFDGAGLHATALLLEEGVDPFAGHGTPAAYHLDADGCVVQDLAVGASDVPVLAAALAGVDPDAPPADRVDVDVDESDADPVPEGTRYVPAPGGT